MLLRRVGRALLLLAVISISSSRRAHGQQIRRPIAKITFKVGTISIYARNDKQVEIEAHNPIGGEAHLLYDPEQVRFFANGVDSVAKIRVTAALSDEVRYESPSIGEGANTLQYVRMVHYPNLPEHVFGFGSSDHGVPIGATAAQMKEILRSLRLAATTAEKLSADGR